MASFDFQIQYQPGVEVVIPDAVKDDALYFIASKKGFVKRMLYPGFWDLAVNFVSEDDGHWRLTFEPSRWERFSADNDIQPGDTLRIHHKRSLFTITVIRNGSEIWLEPGVFVRHGYPKPLSALYRATYAVKKTRPPTTYVVIRKSYTKSNFVTILRKFGEEVLAKNFPKKNIEVKLLVGPVEYDIIIRKYYPKHCSQYKVVKGWKEFVERCCLKEDDIVVFHVAEIRPPIFLAALVFKVE